MSTAEQFSLEYTEDSPVAYTRCSARFPEVYFKQPNDARPVDRVFVGSFGFHYQDHFLVFSPELYKGSVHYWSPIPTFRLKFHDLLDEGVKDALPCYVFEAAQKSNGISSETVQLLIHNKSRMFLKYLLRQLGSSYSLFSRSARACRELIEHCESRIALIGSWYSARFVYDGVYYGLPAVHSTIIYSFDSLLEHPMSERFAALLAKTIPWGVNSIHASTFSQLAVVNHPDAALTSCQLNLVTEAMRIQDCFLPDFPPETPDSRSTFSLPVSWKRET